MTGIDAWSARTRAPSVAATVNRLNWTLRTSGARSTRSISAPAYRPMSTQGSQMAAVTAAIRAGSRVMVAASSGSAATRRPSPRFETAAAVHRTRNSEPSRCLTRPPPHARDVLRMVADGRTGRRGQRRLHVNDREEVRDRLGVRVSGIEVPRGDVAAFRSTVTYRSLVPRHTRRISAWKL